LVKIEFTTSQGKDKKQSGTKRVISLYMFILKIQW